MSRTAIAGLISAMTLLLSGCSSFGSPALRSAGGKLAPCDGGPHCVSSQSDNESRRIEPIRYTGTRAAAQQAMSKIISGMQNAKIVSEQPGYIHATFTSSLMGFVDDVELLFPNEKLIHVRSSSRTGYYDFGVNRNRVEELRRAFNERQP